MSTHGYLLVWYAFGHPATGFGPFQVPGDPGAPLASLFSDQHLKLFIVLAPSIYFQKPKFDPLELIPRLSICVLFFSYCPVGP